MARTPLSDPLLVHEFHLIDVDFSLSIPPWVLIPTVGFSSITAPEIDINSEEITEGTDDFVHHVLKKATSNVITISKGATAFNSDFWRWTVACLQGIPTQAGLKNFLTDPRKSPVPGKRRNLLLMQFTGLSVSGVIEAGKVGTTLDKVRAGLLAPFVGAGVAVNAISNLSASMADVGMASVPAKVFMLMGCQPKRYKPGSDFDASTTAVSIEEMDISMHRFEEIGISA